MLEVCEIVEQKFLRGNTAIEAGNGRYKLISNETHSSPWAFHLKTKANYGWVRVNVGYNCEILSGSIINLEGFEYQFEPDSFLSCAGTANVIDEKILIEQSFETRVWQNVFSLLNENREESALVYLYETLNDELGNAANCDSFLRMSIGMPMTSDIIIHILNGLSPIKSTLKNWEEFKAYSKGLLYNEVGEQAAKILLNAIVIP